MEAGSERKCFVCSESASSKCCLTTQTICHNFLATHKACKLRVHSRGCNKWLMPFDGSMPMEVYGFRKKYGRRDWSRPCLRKLSSPQELSNEEAQDCPITNSVRDEEIPSPEQMRSQSTPKHTENSPPRLFGPTELEDICTARDEVDIDRDDMLQDDIPIGQQSGALQRSSTESHDPDQAARFSKSLLNGTSALPASNERETSREEDSHGDDVLEVLDLSEAAYNNATEVWTLGNEEQVEELEELLRKRAEKRRVRGKLRAAVKEEKMKSLRIRKRIEKELRTKEHLRRHIKAFGEMNRTALHNFKGSVGELRLTCGDD